MFAMFLFDTAPTPLWCFLLLIVLMVLYYNQVVDTRAMLNRALGICEKLREESWAQVARIQQLEAGDSARPGGQSESQEGAAPGRDHTKVLKAFQRPTTAVGDLIRSFCRQWDVQMLDAIGVDSLILHGSPENVEAFVGQLQALGHPLTSKVVK